MNPLLKSWLFINQPIKNGGWASRVYTDVPGSKLLTLGMVILPLMGNPYNRYINPYYWVDDHPLLYGSSGSLDLSTYMCPNASNIRR